MSMSWLVKISDIVPLIVLVLCDDWSSVWYGIRSPTANDKNTFFGRGRSIISNAKSNKEVKNKLEEQILPGWPGSEWIVSYHVPLLWWIIKNFSFLVVWAARACHKWPSFVHTQSVYTCMWIIWRRLCFEINSIESEKGFDLFSLG